MQFTQSRCGRKTNKWKRAVPKIQKRKKAYIHGEKKKKKNTKCPFNVNNKSNVIITTIVQ